MPRNPIFSWPGRADARRSVVGALWGVVAACLEGLNKVARGAMGYTACFDTPPPGVACRR